MPKTPIDYSKCVIYKIVCNDLSIPDVYVGHTTDFVRRKAEHKRSCKNKPYNLYNVINENGGWENWDMVLVEKYSCSCFLDARARERYWIETLQANLNSISSIKYNTDIKEQKKKYYINNRDAILDKSKIYRHENKEHRALYDKKRFQDNKELREKRKEQTICECGVVYSYPHKSRHFKSIKHINYCSSSINPT